VAHSKLDINQRISATGEFQTSQEESDRGDAIYSVLLAPPVDHGDAKVGGYTTLVSPCLRKIRGHRMGRVLIYTGHSGST
jgi:hypothetical protein